MNVSHAVGVIGVGSLPPLHASEMALIQHASAHRIQEFTLGRSVAKQAVLAQNADQDKTGLAILKTPEGLPVWPEGIVGSISHTHNMAVAVCASNTQVKALAVDIEKKRTVNTSLERKLLTENECLQGWGGEPQRALVTLFSIKESIYKAACALAEQPVTLKPFSVTPLENNQFMCDVGELIGRSNVNIKGHYAWFDDVVISLAYCVE